MYVRVKSTPNSPRKSVQIVEGYRAKDGKVKQKIVHYVGIALDDAEEAQLKDMAEACIIKIKLQRQKNESQGHLFDTEEKDCGLMKKRGRKKQKQLHEILPPSEVRLDEIVEERRIIEGVDEVAGHVFDDIYGSMGQQKIFYRRMKDVVLARMVCPRSKYKIQQELSNRFDKEHDLDALYRMMDEVFEQIPLIKQLSFAKTQSLFPRGIDVLLFDVTTLYLETTETDELRQFGYSKDHRFNTTQVVLALATNSSGLPIGYELFAGNCAEVSTLKASIESWKKLFPIGSVCFVGDRAMMSEANIALLESSGYQYVIAAKLQKLPKQMQAEIFDDERYQLRAVNGEASWLGEFKYQERRLLVSYKSTRAKHDRKERQVVLDKIQKQLNKSGKVSKLISNQGVKKYTKIVQDSAIEIDESKVLQAAQWDGFHGVISNITEASAESLLARYASLWKIEESFRINKHSLAMRPIFHWKPERIQAHIALCYMTFTVLRHLEYQVNLMQKVSVNQILEELLNVQASIHVHKRTKDHYRVPGHFSNTARKIYKAFDLDRSLDASVYLK